jgi:predicted sulfurtransferase
MTTTTTSNTTPSDHEDYRIALYYCYIPINNVNDCMARQHDICSSLQLNGRIRISSEGINGVLSGIYKNLLEYESQTTLQLHLNKPLEVKYGDLRRDLTVAQQLFDSLSIKETREVISLFDFNQECSTGVPHDTLSFQHLSDNKEHDSDYSSRPRRLSPREWNDQLLQCQSHNSIILLDARNVYESRVGYFCVEGIPTLLPNTRKYSDLPRVLRDHKETLTSKEKVYVFCTGGVRCEPASVYLQMLVPHLQIYQLEGGIQRYLQEFASDPRNCLFQGKNFVFDWRRTDPCSSGAATAVGKCITCRVPHDDYDNGHAPAQHKEARCCKCRVLILCCNSCRSKLCLWGEEKTRGHLPKLYCGGMSHCMDECNDSGSNRQATII